jgi:hypothetical protein
LYAVKSHELAPNNFNSLGGNHNEIKMVEPASKALLDLLDYDSDYYPANYTSGILSNYEVSRVSGCSICYNVTYGTTTTATDLESSCVGPYVFVGALYTNSETFAIGAYGPLPEVYTRTDLDKPHLYNGVYWYFNESTSFGFTLNPTIQQVPGDVELADGEYRLSWVLDGTIGGYRVGSAIALDTNTNMNKVIYDCPNGVDYSAGYDYPYYEYGYANYPSTKATSHPTGSYDSSTYSYSYHFYSYSYYSYYSGDYHIPSSKPSGQPHPTSQPSGKATSQQIGQPSSHPTILNTYGYAPYFYGYAPYSYAYAPPSYGYGNNPTSQPSGQPSGKPTSQPTSQPSGKPTSQPTSHPTAQPSMQPR